MAGRAPNASAETVLDDVDYCEARDFDKTGQAVALQYYDAFKVQALFAGGWYEAAAELGFSPWATRKLHSW